MKGFLRFLWFTCVIRPLVLLVMGVNIRNREGLFGETPAIIAANHNSHLDTMVLISMFPLALLPRVRPVAAADYFLRNRWLAWFALNIIGIIPLCRAGREGREDPLAGCHEALERGDILVLFPEGSRGEPEKLADFKTGVTHLVKRHPRVPVIPVFMQGLGKALPRGEWVLVPVICDVVVGRPLYWQETRRDFMERLEKEFDEMRKKVQRTVLE